MCRDRRRRERLLVGGCEEAWQDSSEHCHFCLSTILESCSRVGMHNHWRFDMPDIAISSRVTEIPAADPADALHHFEKLLAFETDCWDVQDAITRGTPDFVLLDVRGPQLFQAGHVRGAINLPHGKINERNLATYP